MSMLSHHVIGCAIQVHRQLGPGLLESVYEACLSYALTRAGIYHEWQKPMPITYGDVSLDAGYRLDFWVERELIIELKAVEALLPLHTAQLMTYLRLANCQLGLLINFNVSVLSHGIKRVANGY